MGKNRYARQEHNDQSVPHRLQLPRMQSGVRTASGKWGLLDLPL